MTAHLHWRIYVTQATSATSITLGELEMRSVAGGANLCSGGTASASSVNASQVAANAFDGSTSTRWETTVFPTIPGPWLRYSFASAVDIVQVVLKASSSAPGFSPKACDIQWSDDGTTWTTLFSADGMADWTSSTTYTATAGGVAPVRTTAQSLEVLSSGDGAPDLQTVLLCHFNGTDGATATVDSSSSAKTISLVGSQNALSTTQSKFGGSATTTGTSFGNRWQIADHADFAFGTGQFTVECWIYLTADPDGGHNKIIGQWGSSSNGWWFGFANGSGGSGLTFYHSTTGSDAVPVTGAWTPTLNTWHHVCAERDASNVLRLYANGAVVGSATVTAAFFDSTNTLQIAGDDGNTWGAFYGYLDELRISKAVARYAGAFTPPTSAFSATAASTIPVRVTTQSLEVIYAAGSASGTVAGNIFQVNSGSTYLDPVSQWNNDPDNSASTLTGLITSLGVPSGVTYSSPNWDTVQTDGVAHADLPASVSASYLKWFATGRVITFSGLNAGKTYTLRLYSTAPGSVSVNWTVGASTKALARGSKVEWTGLAPDGSATITATSASTTSGADATLSAAVLFEEQTQPAPQMTVRATVQALETLVATYHQRLMKAVGYAVIGTRPGSSIVKSLGYAVLSDPGFVSDTNTVLLLHFDGIASQSTTIDHSPAGHVVTLTSSTLSTTQKKFGDTALTSSGGGSGNAAIADKLTDFAFGTGQFTIEAWVYYTSFVGTNIYAVTGNFASTTNLGWDLRHGSTGNFGFLYSTTGTDFPAVEAAWTPTTGQWYHVAVDRDSSNVVRVYINGAVHASATVASSFFASTRTLYVGNDGNLNRGFPGYVDEVRISKGVARYHGAFTPPTAAFTEPGSTPTVTRRNPVMLICG